VTFAPLIVADRRVGVATDVDDDGAVGVELPHESDINDNVVAIVSKRRLSDIDLPPPTPSLLLGRLI
jgi:hypothetical protein